MKTVFGKKSTQTVKSASRNNLGVLVHNRKKNNQWIPSFENVTARVSQGNDIGIMKAVEATGLASKTHICAISANGRLLHTFSNKQGNTDTYQGFFGDVGQVLGSSDSFVDVACTTVGDNLEILAVTTDGRLLHAIRYANGSWINSFTQVCPNANTSIKRVSCADSARITNGQDQTLEICAVATDGRLLHTFRNSNGVWQNWFGQLLENAGTFEDVDCCMVSGTPTAGGAIGDAINLKVYATTTTGLLLQTIKLDATTWSSTPQNVTTKVPSVGHAIKVSACQRGYRGTHVVVINDDEQAKVLTQRDDDTWITQTEDLGQITQTNSDFKDIGIADWGANDFTFYGIKETLLRVDNPLLER